MPNLLLPFLRPYMSQDFSLSSYRFSRYHLFCSYFFLLLLPSILLLPPNSNQPSLFLLPASHPTPIPHFPSIQYYFFNFLFLFSFFFLPPHTALNWFLFFFYRFYVLLYIYIFLFLLSFSSLRFKIFCLDYVFSNSCVAVLSVFVAPVRRFHDIISTWLL